MKGFSRESKTNRRSLGGPNPPLFVAETQQQGDAALCREDMAGLDKGGLELVAAGPVPGGASVSPADPIALAAGTRCPPLRPHPSRPCLGDAWLAGLPPNDSPNMASSLHPCRNTTPGALQFAPSFVARTFPSAPPVPAHPTPHCSL